MLSDAWKSHTRQYWPGTNEQTCNQLWTRGQGVIELLITSLLSVTHFAWFSRIYFETRNHARIEQFVSFATHFPISKQIFETEFENQKKIRFPNEYYIVPPYTSAPFVDVILVYFVLQTKVTGFGHSLFYILDLGSAFYCKRAKIESTFQIFSGWFIVHVRHETEIKNIWESV